MENKYTYLIDKEKVIYRYANVTRDMVVIEHPAPKYDLWQLVPEFQLEAEIRYIRAKVITKEEAFLEML